MNTCRANSRLCRDGVAIYPSLAMLRTATTGLRSEVRDTELAGEARAEAMRVSVVVCMCVYICVG